MEAQGSGPNRFLQSKQCFPGSAGKVVKNLPANAGDVREVGLVPEPGRSSGIGNGNTLQYSCLENPMARGAERATVHGISKELSTREYRANIAMGLRSSL